MAQATALILHSTGLLGAAISTVSDTILASQFRTFGAAALPSISEARVWQNRSAPASRRRHAKGEQSRPSMSSRRGDRRG
jgi:hypothetical protein